MKLLIIGAGGHGKCCFDIANRMNCFDSIDFIDDKVTVVLGKTVVGKQEDIKKIKKTIRLCICRYWK